MSLLVQAASYLGNYALSSIVYFKFSVTDATGVLTTLGGTPVVKVYKDAGTTESTAGVTLTVDFDARTGLCQVAIDTSSDGTFYSAGSEFEAVITTGTVGVVSVAGTPVGHFSLLNRVDTLANGVTHGGPTALLRLGSSTATPAFYATNSGGVAFQCECTAGNFSAAYFLGFGSGSGLYGRGGTNGSGIIGMGSKGISALGANTGDCGLKLVGGGGNGPGANAGASALVIDGSNDYCHGIFIQAGSSKGNPINLESLGDNQAILGTVDGTADVMALVATNGNALTLTAAGAGKHDIALTGSADILGKLAANALDNILVESSISAGAGLTDDSGSQLTSINLRQALALIASAVDGVLAGAAGTSITTKPAGKPTGNTRVTATVDASGNRTLLTLKVPT